MELRIHLPYDTGVPNLHIYLREMKMYVPKKFVHMSKKELLKKLFK